jgi:hypothetical protein
MKVATRDADVNGTFAKKSTPAGTVWRRVRGQTYLATESRKTQSI